MTKSEQIFVESMRNTVEKFLLVTHTAFGITYY